MVVSKEKVVKPLPFHDAELRRGWRILHERVDVCVDSARRMLRGRAMITVAALNTQFVSVDLHLRACEVLGVSISGKPAGFEFSDPLRDPASLFSVSSDKHRRRVDDLRGLQSSLAPQASPAELRIPLPPSLSADLIELLDALQPEDAAAAAAAAAAASSNAPLPPMVTSVDQLPSLVIVVDYYLESQTGAVSFFGDPPRVVIDGRGGKARGWMPCVDTRNWCDRCPWDLVYYVPQDDVAVSSGDLLETRLLLSEDDIDDNCASFFPRTGDRGRLEASGDLPTRRQSSRRLGTSELSVGVRLQGGRHLSAADVSRRLQLDYPVKRYTYRVDASTHAGDIAVAVGPLLPLADQSNPATVTHFCLPGRSRELVHTMPDIFARVRTFCCDYFNMEPPGNSFKYVFAGESHVGMDSASMMREPWVHANCAAGGLVVFPESLLHSERCIDEGFHSRMAITYAVVSAYIGSLIRPRASEDSWFVAGLTTHVTILTLTYILGKNWHNVYIHEQIREMAEEGASSAPVLADVAKDPSFCMSTASPSVRRRALLITYLVERRIGSEVLRRVLRDLVAETSRSLCAGNTHDELQLGLSVGPFLKRIRAVCGTDVRNLVRSWAASRGTPRMRFGYRYNGRRHQAEFAIEQKAVSHGEVISRDREGLLFQGSLTVRVMEPEGSFDHTVEVIDPVFVAELSCHCRRTKQKPVTQAEKDAGEEPARILPISWARVDPEMEWCMDVTFIQTELAWIAMLQGERDAVAQINACRGLAEYGTGSAAKALLECLENGGLFWRVRVEAARALAVCENGIDYLLDFLVNSYVEPRCSTGGELANGVTKMREPERDEGLFCGGLTGNDFSDFGEYMVRRAVVGALVSPWTNRQRKGTIPLRVCRFILKLLTENDNSRNPYDDDHYVADLVTCAGDVAVRCIETGVARDEVARELTEQIRRYRRIDEFVPSRSGAVAAAVVRSLSDIETCRIACRDGKDGGLTRDDAIQQMLLCSLRPDPELMHHIAQLSKRKTPLVARTSAYIALARLYGGDLETLQWVISRVDRASSGDDVLELRGLPTAVGEAPYVEPRCVRRAVLYGLVGAASSRLWKGPSPILTALRRNTRRAVRVCSRVLRLAVADSDDGVRSLAVDFAEMVWGQGVPVCLLDPGEYQRVRANTNVRTKEPLKREHGKQPLATVKSKKPLAPPPSVPKSAPRKPLGIPKSVPDKLIQPPHLKKPVTATLIPRSQPVQLPPANGSVKVASVPSRAERSGVSVKVPLSMPMSKPQAPSQKDERGKELLMTEEDRDYLIRVWNEYKAKPRAAVSVSLNGLKEGPRETCAPVVRIKSGGDVSVVGDAHGGGQGSEHRIDVDDEEERRRRRREKKERKRLKKEKKRKREAEGFVAGDGDDVEDGHHKRKKKKKKKRDRGDGTAELPESAGFPSAGFSASHVPSSEGSLRSDGKLAILKIKLATNAAHVSNA